MLVQAALVFLSFDLAANVPCPSHPPLRSFSGIYEVLLKNLRSKEYKPNGAGAWLIFFNLCISFFSIRLFRNINQPLATLVSCLIVDSHIIAVGTYSRYAKSYVFCCSVADRFDFQCDSIFLCVADNVQVMVMWQQH